MSNTSAFVNEYPIGDQDYEEHQLVGVREENDGWELRMGDIGATDGSMCFFLQKPSPVTPETGQIVRCYGRFGYPVRGIFLNGVKSFYRTPAEQDEIHRKWCEEQERKRKEEFEKNREDMDRRVAALPEVFQRRIQKFRDNNPDFRWEYEPYELFTCEQAVLIANALRTPEKVKEYHDLPWEKQKELVPGLDDGHSGNTFGCACLLAHHYLTHQENVYREHGALVPLVGCIKYGCVHPLSEEADKPVVVGCDK